VNKLRVILFFALLGVVILIARHNSKPTSRPESPTFSTPESQIASTNAASSVPTPAPAASPSPPPKQDASANFQAASERIRSAVILLSVFDNSGKLLRNGTGFFIADDGRFITSKSVVEGAAYAVAKTSDGGLYNVSGFLTEAGELAVLKAEPKKTVLFIGPLKAESPAKGAPIAAIPSPLSRQKSKLVEGIVSAEKSDLNGSWLEASAPIPPESLGAPVIIETGEVVGVVASQTGPGGTTNIVRTAGEVEAMVKRIATGAVAAWPPGAVPPPAESPPEKGKTLVGRKPTNSRLIYNPIPQYPLAARHSHFPIKGSGRYRVTFNGKGDVSSVEVVQSTHSDTLDTAATDALRKWKAAPGQEWTATVPITFQP